MKGYVVIAAIAIVVAAAAAAIIIQQPDADYGVDELAYGAGPRQKMDISVPGGDGTYPIVMYVHGGGWNSGDKSEGIGYRSVLNSMGCAYVSMNYRFVEKDKVALPEILDDMRSAVLHLKDHSAEYRLDVGRMGLMGASAGGHLSMMYAYTAESPIPVEFAVSGCGPTDFTDPDFYGNIATNLPHMKDLGASLANSLAGTSFSTEELKVQTADSFKQELLDCSPVKYVDGKQPKTLLAYGMKDVIVSHTNAERMVAKMQSTDSRFDYVPFPGSGHELNAEEDAGPRQEFYRILASYVEGLRDGSP